MPNSSTTTLLPKNIHCFGKYHPGHIIDDPLRLFPLKLFVNVKPSTLTKQRLGRSQTICRKLNQ